MIGLLARLVAPKAEATLPPYLMTIEGRAVTVIFKRNAQAKRLVMRLSKDGQGVVLTLPPRVSRDRGIAFAQKSTAWLARQLSTQKPLVVLGADISLPLRGETYRVLATGQLRGIVSVDAAHKTITVPGDACHVGRRLQDWLKKQALADLASATAYYAKAMKTSYGKLSIRDQKSRWGSCSSTGDISYNWRLILAPDYVLRYVAAHEVAHRLEMNHSPRFWRHVLTHCPEAPQARNWLKRHGSTLHSYKPGAPPAP